MKTYKSNIDKLVLKKIKSDFKKVKIARSSDSYNYIKQFYSDDIGIFESFFLLLMNKANITTGYVKISQGGIASTVVDKTMIAKYAIDSLASSVILAHNHPSGNTEPSNADKTITREITAALGLFNIPVLDHIILTEDNGYLSFADEGLI